MSNKSIADIKAALLREAVQAKGLKQTKPSFLSKIYPATDHGPNHPPRRVDLKSMPEVDHDKDAKGDDKTKEKDEPALPSLDRIQAKEIMMNVRATSFVPPKQGPLAAEDRGPKFVRRCVAAITDGQVTEREQQQECCGKIEQKTNKPLAKGVVVADGSKLIRAMNKFKKQGHG